MNDNHDNDYREEEGQYRHAKRIERALINNDRDYPNELHEQDVMDFYTCSTCYKSHASCKCEGELE